MALRRRVGRSDGRQLPDFRDTLRSHLEIPVVVLDQAVVQPGFHGRENGLGLEIPLVQDFAHLGDELRKAETCPTGTQVVLHGNRGCHEDTQMSPLGVCLLHFHSESLLLIDTLHPDREAGYYYTT